MVTCYSSHVRLIQGWNHFQVKKWQPILTSVLKFSIFIFFISYLPQLFPHRTSTLKVILYPPFSNTSLFCLLSSPFLPLHWTSPLFLFSPFPISHGLPTFHIFHFPHTFTFLEGGGSQWWKEGSVRVSEYLLYIFLFRKEFHQAAALALSNQWM